MKASLVQAAFTIVELLVVIAIFVLLAGFVFLTSGKQQRGAQVQQQAEKLAATLRQVRRLAMGTQAMHAVVFNIQNEPGSSGAVLNNRSGGHWYRVLGPCPRATDFSWRRTPGARITGTIPFAADGMDFPDFLTEVEISWIGNPIVLPAKGTRFLAIGDQDEGPRLRGGNSATPSATGALWYGSAGETTYPRPWFGYFDGTRLWPWGGYDASKAYSGFYYQGSDGPITGCRNPADRKYDNNFNQESQSPQGGLNVFQNVDHNSDGDFDDPWEREEQFPVLRKDEPRALVNADWMDACIAFLPSGEALFLEWNRGRRMYVNVQMTLANAAPARNANGVRDMCKVRLDYTKTPVSSNGIDACFNLYTAPYEHRSQPVEDIPEVAHFDRHTGGWHVTLAPDALEDRVEFPNAKEALASMMPMWRVFVGRNGVVQAFPVNQREGFLQGRTVWPATPGDWIATANSVGNPVWSNCRIGWLHRADTGTANGGTLVARGQAITDVIESSMLQQRVWWLDE